jgi:hypothetical protein
MGCSNCWPLAAPPFVRHDQGPTGLYLIDDAWPAASSDERERLGQVLLGRGGRERRLPSA